MLIMKKSYLKIFRTDITDPFINPIYDLDCPEKDYIKMEIDGLRAGNGARVIVPTEFSFEEIEKHFEKLLKNKIVTPECFLTSYKVIMKNRIVPEYYSDIQFPNFVNNSVPEEYSILYPVKCCIKYLLGGVLTKYPNENLYGLLIATPELLFATETKKLKKFMKSKKLI